NIASPSPVFDIASGASLTLSNFVTFNAGPRNGMVKTGAGRLTMPRFTFGNLRIEGGTLAITPGNTAGGNFFKPYSLALLAGAKLDLTNNNFVAASGNNDLNIVRQQVASAYANGNWNGTSATTGNITS